MGNTVQNGCSGRDTGSTCDGLVGRPDGDDVYVYSDPPPVFGQRVSGKSRSNRAAVRRSSWSSPESLFARGASPPRRRLTSPALSFIFASEDDMLSLPSPKKPRTPKTPTSPVCLPLFSPPPSSSASKQR